MAVTRLDVKELIKVSTKLPTLPAVAMQILKLANDPNTAADDIANIMTIDPSLSAKVLKLVNSSYYGVRNTVSSVKQAVVILGFETIRSLALSTAVMEKFSSDDTGVGLSRTELWKHSLGVAMTNRLIAAKLGRGGPDQELFYMAGLLHDIGKVILDQHFFENFAAILARSREMGISFHAAEKQLNDVSHDEIGCFLAKQWGLPVAIAAAIRHHHEPLAATEYFEIVDATHFADILTKTKSMGSGGDDDITGLVEASVARLGLSQDAVGALVETDMDREFAGAREILALLE